MMVQVNCRGYATAQYMQPEPAKYAHAPNLEAKTFMQPEQPYYAHHPGRFFYVKDLRSGELFSAPYEPVRSAPDDFEFVAGQSEISWRITQNMLQIDVSLSLMRDRPVELWSVKISNLDTRSRMLSLTPYFPVGYMSWMNQSGSYDADLQAIICRSVTPYQHYADYFRNRDFKDLTCLIAESSPATWEARQSAFEGEGGLGNPDALQNPELGNSDAIYETPAAVMQYPLSLQPDESRYFRFAFGPARDEQEVAEIRREVFGEKTAFDNKIADYFEYHDGYQAPLEITTPDTELDHFVNHWLPRQVYYHGDVNRLSTDPQTRNYLQDSMGMAYLEPARTRAAFLHALSQQFASGAMPDGILLHDEAELKYINTVPHMDHCVWLPVCLSAYLDETADYAILKEVVGFADSEETATVDEHISRALRWLYEQRDERGLNYIAQGDWCDPMNMVGYKGKGVSGWLTLATAYACELWSQICQQHDAQEIADEFLAYRDQCNSAVNRHLWQGNWFARGITDDGDLFGIESDQEGKIFLNPQAWAMLSGAAGTAQQKDMQDAVGQYLETPYGVQMLAPAYTGMREDIGRVTQKFPGSAENGSVYNHAAAFYVYALYETGQYDQAYKLMRQMIPGPDREDLLQRGQLPVFIPNYYRGAWQQHPRTAGRSSQLFNTGTVHWIYRCLVDGLFGLRGCKDGLMVRPQLPAEWQTAKVVRRFRGAEFHIEIARKSGQREHRVLLNGHTLPESLIRDIEPGQQYKVEVVLGDD